jgi:deazaflavin-dependent oxidoreductase (nitroreductase family)
MSDMNEWNRQIIEEFRANDGEVGGMFAGRQLLLLHHTGARSGLERVNPLVYRQVGDSIAVFASKGGAPTNPDWYYNLLAHPAVSIEIKSERKRALARIARGEERERIWQAHKAEFPDFAEYELKAKGRQIPVVVLDPA